MELRLDALDNHKVVTEALNLVNTHFRGLSSLQGIIVEVYKDGSSDDLRRKIESHGWTISITGYMCNFKYEDYIYECGGGDADDG